MPKKLDQNIQEIARNLDITNALHRESALKLIDLYLKSNPNNKNKKFFERIRSLISHDKKSIYTALTNALVHYKSAAKKPAQFTDLFTQWLGSAQSSDATLCLKQLYTLATGQPLTTQQVTDMITKSNLPDGDQKDYDETKIRQLLANPIQYPDTAFKRKVLTAYVNLKQADEAIALQEQQRRAAAQSQAEAAYQQKILEKAIDLVNALPVDELCFDPQGHVMVEVPPLTQIELWEISGKDTEILQALDVDQTKGTLCSVDTRFLPYLHEQFQLWIMNVLPAASMTTTLLTAIEQLTDADGRSLSSIIPLQKEMTLHIMLAMRVFQAKTGDSGEYAAEWQHILKHTVMYQNIQRLTLHFISYYRSFFTYHFPK